MSIFTPEEDSFNWKKFVEILGASCLIAGMIMGTVIYYLTKPSVSPLNFTANTVSQETDLKIKGNKNSRIYHLPGCPNYNDIAERNIVWFKTTEEAEKAGYRMARNC